MPGVLSSGVIDSTQTFQNRGWEAPGPTLEPIGPGASGFSWEPHHRGSHFFSPQGVKVNPKPHVVG